MEYRQLIISERHIIMIRLKDGRGLPGIALELGRSPSCIRREVARNAWPYDAEAAQKRAAGLKHARQTPAPCGTRWIAGSGASIRRNRLPAA